tara:strand:- start:192 stop:608 length:417 start_codon:yes stop_codon:yes gene_type:complete
MNIIEHFKNNLKTVLVDRATDFNGRSDRPEYWFFSLYTTLVMFVVMGIDKLIGIQFFNWLDPFSETSNSGIFSVLWIFGTLFQSFSVTARRLHDRGHSGWWIIGLFVPVLNIIVFYWLVRDAKDTTDALSYSNPYGTR